jgi:Protein of unknown function (DUF2971)
MSHIDGSPAPSDSEGACFLKYMTCAAGKIVLQNRTLRWSTPGTLNDPYDTQFYLHIDVDREQLRVITLGKIWDAYAGEHPAPIGNILGIALRLLRQRVPGLSKEDIERQFNDVVVEGIERGERHLPQLQADLRPHVAQTKILCLTRGLDPDSALMWAHYADGHRGMVLRFRSPLGVDSPYRVARPVEYRAVMPRLVDAEFLADMMSGRVRMDVRAIMERLVYTKSKEWEYEQEWRISSGSGRNPEAPFEDILFNALELDAVILGCRMAKADREEISNLTRRLYPHAYILQANKADRNFRFEISFAT